MQVQVNKKRPGWHSEVFDNVLYQEEAEQLCMKKVVMSWANKWVEDGKNKVVINGPF